MDTQLNFSCVDPLKFFVNLRSPHGTRLKTPGLDGQSEKMEESASARKSSTMLQE